MSDAKTKKVADISSYSIRIGPSVMNDVLEKVKDLSGVVVVRHNDAKQPHLHIWYSFKSFRDAKDPITDFKKATVSVFGIKKEGKLTNGDWAWAYPNTTLLEYWKYVIYDKIHREYKRPEAELLLWNIPQPQLPIPDDIPAKIVETPRNVLVVKAPKEKTTEEKMHAFFLYCDAYYKENLDESYNYEGVAKLLFHRHQGGFDRNTAPRYIYHVLYKLSLADGEGPNNFIFQQWYAGLRK